MKHKHLMDMFIRSNKSDSSLNIKVDNRLKSFDCYRYFGKEFTSKLITDNSIDVELSKKDYFSIIEEMEKSSTNQQVLEIIENNGIGFIKKNLLKKLSDNTELDEETISEIIDCIEVESSRQNELFLKIKKRTEAIVSQETIWPLHISTLFLYFKNQYNEEYLAPLILKEVRIEGEYGKLRLVDTSDWKINEKLLLVLEKDGYNISSDINIGINEYTSYIFNHFNISPVNLNGSLKSIKQIKETSNKNRIQIIPGTVLGFFQPSGGKIRKALANLIENDLIDKIIDCDILEETNKCQNNISSSLKSNKKIIKINKTNWSQDKAILSGLSNNTIIWGPPGTGKSQTIVNLIANIFYTQKTAIVVSQKKAALDVIFERLKDIKQFCLFSMPNTKDTTKEDFYKPLQDLYNSVINSSIMEDSFDINPICNISLVDNLQIIQDLKSKNLLDKYIDLINKSNQYIQLSDRISFFDAISQLDKNLIYPKNSFNIKQVTKELAEKNNIKKEGFFIFKNYPEYVRKNAFTFLYKIKNQYKDKVNDFIKILENIDIRNLDNVQSFIKDFPAFFHSDDSYSENCSKYLYKYLSLYFKQRMAYLKSSGYKINSFIQGIKSKFLKPENFVSKFSYIMKELFPIIITTPENSILDYEYEKYDYVILDEASQIFTHIGIPVLSMGKTKIIAGDQKQMKPTSWFSKSLETEDEQELEVEEFSESILEYAKNKGMYEVMLNKNYRSESSALMAFSSKHFYKSELDVMDKISNLNQESIEVLNIDGQWEDSTNIKEAEEVIKQLEINLNKYPNIIILTFNAKQKEYIEKLIVSLGISSDIFRAYENDKISIKNIENIQGDEAELVIASVSYDNTTKLWSTYVCRKGGSNSLNVAISRAKKKMIVIKSIRSEDITFSSKSQDMDIFKEWLRFLDLSQEDKSFYVNLKRGVTNEYNSDFDSEFEKDVAETLDKFLAQKVQNIKIVNQFSVGTKRIDLAILDNSSNSYIVGIEVDGYKYHSGIEKILEDKSRQEYIESKGYKIKRILELDWKMKKHEELKKIEKTIFDYFDRKKKLLN